MIEFRQKDFSLSSNIIKGAGLGANLGTLVAGIGFRRKKSIDPDFDEKFINKQSVTIVLTGAALGAFIGMLVSSEDVISKKSSMRSALNNRLMKTVVDALKSAGLKEGTDFTRDPKEASRLKTKICIVVSRSNGDLRVAINQVSDPKLKEITRDLVKNIPNTSAVTEKQSDRFNDIVITSISDSSADAGLVTGIAERFIHSGYPVQLVEVG